MITLFNDNWEFSEIPLDNDSMYKDKEPVLFTPDQFLEAAKKAEYKNVRIPHDWMIHHTKDLYKNSVGCYSKSFTLKEEDVNDRHTAIRFEGVYMNSAVWVNGQKAGEWKYGY